MLSVVSIRLKRPVAPITNKARSTDKSGYIRIDMFFRMYEIMNCLFRLSSCNRYECNLYGTKNGHDRVTGITCDEGDVGEQEAVVECAVCIRVRFQMARCILRESHTCNSRKM